MNLLRMITNGASVVFACLCVATMTVQVIGGYALWTNGGFAPEKLRRYAAVLYGLDLSEVPLAGGEGGSATDEELLTPEQIVKHRVSQSQLLADRAAAIQRGGEASKQLVAAVREENDRFENVKATFDGFLQREEQAAREAAVQEVERTLAVLSPRQSKELLVKMLDERGIDPDDDVMRDIVTIVKAMPDAKLRKIFSEFKSEAERERLKEIIAAIGGINQE